MRRARRPREVRAPTIAVESVPGWWHVRLRVYVLPTIGSNARGSWRKAHRETQFWDLLLKALLVQGGGLPPGGPLQKARLELVRCSLQPPDWDGLAVSFKHPVDALVSAGLLRDDSIEVVGYPATLWLRAENQAEQRIELIVTGEVPVRS